ncbi:MAG: LytR/AlgR family response regulator transcription factor, partial [Marinicella sp.]
STAHDDFALQAFDLSATDYLLKPLSIERLKQAMDKVGFSCNDDKIRAKRGNDVIMISANDIICLLAEDKYVTAHLNDQNILLDQSLAEIEQEYAMFLRIHRNALINKNFLKGIHTRPGQSTLAILEHTEIQPTISRRQLSAVKKILKEL